MTFRTMYVVLIILTFFGIFFLFLLKDPLIYMLYGYESRILGEYTAEAFVANQSTALARDISAYLVAGVTFLCFVASCVAIYRNVYLEFYLTQISLVISFLLSVYRIFGLIMMHAYPRRSF